MTLVVVTGVGTEIGKTHVASALLLAWGRQEPVIGYKPIESGVVGEIGADEAQLERLSTFHVKHPVHHVRLRAPLSPHLAARLEGRTIDLAAILGAVRALRREATVIVELPGGLFSPLANTCVNADLVSQLRPDHTLLVAPDRLGVLHDVRAVHEAAVGRGLRLAGVVLNAAAAPDGSSSTNADELSLTSGMTVLASLPRGAVEALADSAAIGALVRLCRVARP